jgi:hypothetical protein
MVRILPHYFRPPETQQGWHQPWRIAPAIRAHLRQGPLRRSAKLVSQLGSKCYLGNFGLRTLQIAKFWLIFARPATGPSHTLFRAQAALHLDDQWHPHLRITLVVPRRHPPLGSMPSQVLQHPDSMLARLWGKHSIKILLPTGPADKSGALARCLGY